MNDFMEQTKAALDAAGEAAEQMYSDGHLGHAPGFERLDHLQEMAEAVAFHRTPCPFYSLEGRLVGDGGSYLEIKWTLREAPSLADVQALKEGLKEAFETQTGRPVVADNISLVKYLDPREWGL